jgi:hypothetical protein
MARSVPVAMTNLRGGNCSVNTSAAAISAAVATSVPTSDHRAKLRCAESVVDGIQFEL